MSRDFIHCWSLTAVIQFLIFIIMSFYLKQVSTPSFRFPALTYFAHVKWVVWICVEIVRFLLIWANIFGLWLVLLCPLIRSYNSTCVSICEITLSYSKQSVELRSLLILDRFMVFFNWYQDLNFDWFEWSEGWLRLIWLITDNFYYLSEMSCGDPVQLIIKILLLLLVQNL